MTALVLSAIIAIDLDIPADNYEAFLRTRYSLDMDEVVFYWTGSVYAFPEGEAGIHIFDGEGFNVARLEETSEGYRMLSREIFIYRDPETGAILETWANPLTGDTVTVHPVANDPVNAVFPRRIGDWEFSIPYTLLGDGTVSWDVDILIAYPSPIPADSFPELSGSNTYQGAEMFHFFTDAGMLGDTALASVPCMISWTRMGQWLPWMRMGPRRGWLLYSCVGYKLEGGYADLPADLKLFVEERAPGFEHAPAEYSRPNATSWTSFRRLLDEGVVSP